MTSEMPSGGDRWASIRRRQRADGSTSYTVLYWLDGKQSPLTLRDERAAEALCAAIKAHGVHRALQPSAISVYAP